MQTDRVCGLSIKADIDWSAGSCSYDLVWYEEWLDDYHGITVIRISSVSWGLWYNLNKTRIEKPHSACLPGNLAKEKKKERKKKNRPIWQEVNLNEDQQRSIPAGLFDGSPSYCERGESKRKDQLHPFPWLPCFPLSIPTSLNPSLFLQISPAPPLHPSSCPRQRHYVLTQPAKGTN